MKSYPSLEKAKTMAEEKKYKVIPVSCEMFADIKTPIEVLKVLKGVSPNTYMLESIEDNKNRGRYTFLGFHPSLELTCLNGVLCIKGALNTTIKTDNPGQYIREIIKEHKSPKLEELPPFTGGFVGYFAYDYIKYAEPKLKFNAKDEENFKDVDLMLFDKVIAFDHLRQKIILIVNAKLEQIDTEYPKAIDELNKMIRLIQYGKKQEEQIPKLKSEVRKLFCEEDYCQMVEIAKKHIYEGDIFQVVLSNRFDADFEGSLLDVYRVLRTTNPSPYMFYFSSNDLEIAGASPETLVKLKDGVVHTFPLAGTRPRGSDERHDQELKNELLADEKELAEHNMLVDLGRNDLGKICEFNTVGVDKYMSVEFFSHVMHIGSTVSGKLRNDKDAIDAVEAVLPAGTLSGAPKIKACEIINKLENNKRGIYGGAIGYIDFTGNLDTCIAIRLAVKKNGKVFIRSGAGIVADSVPKREYEECLNKAKAVLDAIEIAREGIV